MSCFLLNCHTRELPDDTFTLYDAALWYRDIYGDLYSVRLSRKPESPFNIKLEERRKYSLYKDNTST